MSISKTIITGFVTEDVNFQTTQRERSFATVSVAVARPYQRPGTGEPIFDLFKVVLWNGHAEHASINVASGQTVAVEGRMECRPFLDRDNVERLVWELRTDRQIEIIASAPDIEGYVTLKSP